MPPDDWTAGFCLLRLDADSGAQRYVPVRSQIEQLFQADMKSIGIKINIQNYDANTLFGTVGPKGEFDLIEFAWVQSPFASNSQSIYCSYINASNWGDNWDHYADPKTDSLFEQALGRAGVEAGQRDDGQVEDRPGSQPWPAADRSPTARWARSTCGWVGVRGALAPGSGWCRCSATPGRC